MDEQWDGSRKIRLEWRIAAFIHKNVADVKTPETIEEYLDPKDFYSEDRKRAYWSVPERLIDVYWLSERLGIEGIGAERQRGGFPEELSRCEFCLHRVVETLGAWSATYTKCIKEMEENEEDPSWLALWQENESFLKELADTEDADQSFDFNRQEDLSRLYFFAKKLEILKISDSRRKALKETAKQFTLEVERDFGPNAEVSFSLILLLEEQKNTLRMLAIDFCKKAIDFFENDLWRTKSSTIKNLQDLAKKIERAEPEWHPAQTEIWSQEYQDSVWNGLQKIADSACKAINGANKDGSITIKDILQRAKEVVKALNLQSEDSNKVKNQLKRYTEDFGRCVALLEMSHGTCLMAFSGFLDCEDPDTQRVLECPVSADIESAFQAIAKSIGAQLVVFSTEIVDLITRYTLNFNCQFSERGPLRAELLSLDKSALKGAYSCCERKILAAVNAGSIPKSKTAVLHVKFEPCMSCYGALQEWIKNTGVHLKLDCPERW